MNKTQKGPWTNKYHEAETTTETYMQAKQNEQYCRGGGVEKAAALGRVKMHVTGHLG